MEFLCPWLKTLKEAKHKRGYFLGKVINKWRICVLQIIFDVDNHGCWIEDNIFIHGGVILISLCKSGFDRVKNVETTQLCEYMIDYVLLPNKKKH